MVVINWMRQVCGGAIAGPSWKEADLLSILTEELPEEQVVVWFAYNAELAAIWKAVRDAGISATWITGETTMDERAARIQRFQSGTRRVLLIQQACGQYGLDLSAADTAIYYSSTYRCELRMQSEERIFAVGKPNDLLVIDMVTNDSVDEVVLESVAMKKADGSLLLAKIKLGNPNPRNAA
jgi:SNF2 family DNA or RNA helicase